MKSSRIVLVSSGGEILFDGVSVLAAEPTDEPPAGDGGGAGIEVAVEVEVDADHDACPPTKRSYGSGIFEKKSADAAA